MSDYAEEEIKHKDFKHIKTDGIVGHKSKKDTKKWCKGKVGREHVYTIEINPQFQSYRYKCDANARWLKCIHHKVCVNCGKHKGYFLNPAECPVIGKALTPHS